MSTHTVLESFARTRIGTGPGLLVAHGAGNSMANTFGPILEGLASRYTVVGIDYPGSGDTPRAAGLLSLDELADQLVAAADAEGLDRFALSGFSLGGAVAIRAAARHPERVTALVVTASIPHRDNRIALATSVWRKIAESGDRELLAEFLLLISVGTRALEAVPPEQLPEMLDFAAATAAEGSPEQATLAGQVDVRNDLPKVKVPTLVISTAKDWLTSTTLHREIADTIPGAELVEIDTGHLPMVERPDEWLKLITDFVDDHHA